MLVVRSMRAIRVKEKYDNFMVHRPMQSFSEELLVNLTD